MDATSKTDTVAASDAGLAPSTIPRGCSDAQNGVSVRNVYTPKTGYEWYVFRADHGREDKAYRLLGQLGIETYLPINTVYVRKPTGIKPVKKKMMPYFVLAYLTAYEAQLFTKDSSADHDTFYTRSDEDRRAIFELRTVLSVYYDHFSKERHDATKNPPLTVPSPMMDKFIIATLPQDDVIPVFPGEFRIGEEVEVIEGPFKGLTGMVMRPGKKKTMVRLTNDTIVSPPMRDREGKRRLFFKVPCLGSFGTAYIPTAYFQKIVNR